MAHLRVALRADASAQIGTGHITRCSALAQALRACGATTRLVTRRMDVPLEVLLEGSGHVILPATAAASAPRGPVPHAAWARVDWEIDAEQTIAALREFTPTHVIVDHYAFDARWHRKVAAGSGAAIVIIDDLADRELDGVLLVDHNAAADHRAKYAGRWPDNRRLLGGPRFALLNQRYERAARATTGPRVDSIGVFMGGADAGGWSRRVLDACRDLARFTGAIEIVSTSANPRLTELRAACAASPNTSLSVDQPDLADFYARHDLQIGAGGGAAWERCCVGAPTLIIATADNQTVVVDELARRGAAATTTPRAFPDNAAIGAALTLLLADAGLRAGLAQRSRGLVDGLGALRVALSLSAASLTVRLAGLDDSAQVFAWRNDPATRAVSLDSAEIARETHESWFERALADPARILLMGMVGTRAVGVIRFDRRDAGEQEISLFLDPALHGLGLGAHLLNAGEAHIGPARFLARVVEGNKKSRELFATAGYRNETPGNESPGVWRKE